MIEIRKLTKIYREQASVPVTALDSVSLSFEEGSFSAVAGPSGSGKTTLLNLIGGLDRATSGEVQINDHVLGGMDDHQLADFRLRNLGFVFQAFNLIPVLSAYENVEFLLLMQGVPADERRERVGRELRDFGLGDQLLHRRPSELSGGQQQRVAVARATVARPRLILADEPTANLDSETGRNLLTKMRELNTARGITFLFSTHDPMVMEFATRLVLLRDGKVVEDRRKDA